MKLKSETRVSRTGLILLALAGGTLLFVSIVEAANITTIGKTGATATKLAVRVDPPGPPTTPPTQPPPTGPPGGYFTTLPVGAALPGDATCASLVRAKPEIRPDNVTFNHTKATLGPQSDPYYNRVTGNFTGTTDELIQWASCKWGFDEDTIRAQVAKESSWHQNAAGDFTSNASVCVPGRGIGADGRPGQCPESIGLLQLRYQYWGASFPGAITSSAFNLDYALAARRSCFEGRETWLGGSYAAGDLWGCMGLWFSGQWHTAEAETYIAAVKDYLARRVWEQPDFVNW